MNQPLKRDPSLERVLKEMNDLADSYQTRGGADAHLFSFFERLPMPAWIKRSSGALVRTNIAYAERYGLKPEDYVHNPSHWDELIAKSVAASDIEVVHEGEPVFVIEQMTNPLTGEERTLFVIKWPLELEIHTPGGFPLKDMGATGGFVVADTPRIENLTAGEIGAEIFIKPDMRWVMRAPNEHPS